MKHYACMNNGNPNVTKKRGNRPEHLSLNQWDTVIPISEELFKSEYPLEFKEGKIQVDEVKKEKIKTEALAIKTETERIKTKVKNKEDISNTELAWLQGHGR